MELGSWAVWASVAPEWRVEGLGGESMEHEGGCVQGKGFADVGWYDYMKKQGCHKELPKRVGHHHCPGLLTVRRMNWGNSPLFSSQEAIGALLGIMSVCSRGATQGLERKMEPLKFLVGGSGEG